MALENDKTELNQVEEKPVTIRRRAFLVTAATAVGLVATANCAPTETAAPAPTPVLTGDEKYLHVPPAPAQPPATYRFFNTDQVRTLDAFVARILPGTPDDPGAREAGVTLFIDNVLATTQGFIEPTYIKPPFAKSYQGDTPPDEPGIIWVPEDEMERYGFQLSLTPHEMYRRGLRGLDQIAQSAHAQNFADLTASQQDELVGKMADGEDLGGDSGAGAEGGNVEGFGELSPQAFFEYVHKHVIQGMFSDPQYGGNRDFAGWKLVGYPGAQRAYTIADLKNENFKVAPQGLAHLDPLHPGHRTRPEIILPVQSGRE